MSVGKNIGETQNLTDTQSSMLELVQKESEHFLPLNKFFELQNLRKIIHLSTLHELKYNAQELMMSKNEESTIINQFIQKKEEDMTIFDDIITNLERVIKRLRESEKVKARCKFGEDK